MNIVLVEPEIPQNTGNIARTCAATGTTLHLVRPLGFSVEDKYLKRAGLDYWKYLDVKYYDSFDEVRSKHMDSDFYYATTKGYKCYADFSYKENSFFVFGKETGGLPEKLLRENLKKSIRIPMKDEIRSLNLANSVAIVLFEAIRQNSFKGLCEEGRLKQE